MCMSLKGAVLLHRLDGVDSRDYATCLLSKKDCSQVIDTMQVTVYCHYTFVQEE